MTVFVLVNMSKQVHQNCLRKVSFQLGCPTMAALLPDRDCTLVGLYKVGALPEFQCGEGSARGNTCRPPRATWLLAKLVSPQPSADFSSSKLILNFSVLPFFSFFSNVNFNIFSLFSYSQLSFQHILTFLN